VPQHARSDVPTCSFCGKRHDEVEKLIAGPDVNICDECVGLCSEIVAEDRSNKKSPRATEDVNAYADLNADVQAPENRVPPIAACGPCKYIVAGALLLLFLILVALPIDPRIGATLLTAASVVGMFCCFHISKKRASQVTSDARYLMRNICWDFSQSAPENFESFIDTVSAQARNAGSWVPHEPISDVGPLILEFHPYWKEDGGDFTRVTLDPPAGSEWTQGLLIHALHQKLHAEVKPSESVRFKGLMRVAPGRYLLFLGR